ncbi:MAG: hypothetical protein ABMB14_17380 [Myxococcota bacterium]
MRWIWVIAAAGCNGDDAADDTIVPPTDDTETDPDPTGTTGDTGEARPGPDLVVAQADSYAATVDWTVGSVTIRPQFDTVLSWSGITTDAWGAPLDPASVPVLALIEVLYPPDEVGAHLAADDFGFELLSVWQAPVDGLVFAHLTDFVYQSTPFDPVAYLVPEPGKTWLAALAETDGSRLDLRTVLALEVGGASDASRAEFTDTSAAVAWSAAFPATAITTATGWETYTIDWSGVTTDALGKPYDKELGDRLFIGKIDGVTTAALGDAALDLPSVATEWWTMDVARDTEARLEFARDEANDAFPGFTAGTWVVGVTCSTCLSPFPLWATTLTVE